MGTRISNWYIQSLNIHLYWRLFLSRQSWQRNFGILAPPPKKINFAPRSLYSGCWALHGFNPDQKKDRNTEPVNKFEPNFFIRPIEKSVLAIYDINGLSKITNLLDVKKSGTYRSSSAAPDCIRSNSEKGDSENKQKICVQVFKPTFHEKQLSFYNFLMF